MFFPTSPRPPKATILQVPAISLVSLSGGLPVADRGCMRTSRSSLATIGLGLGALGLAATRAFHVAHTAFALFLAAAILVELFEEPERERSREPILTERFRLSCAVQIAAVIVLGPWAGALVAAVGVAAGSLFRGSAFRALLF